MTPTAPRFFAHARHALGVGALCLLVACPGPRGFIECVDDTSCGLAPGGHCTVNQATGHQFCAYPDQACPEGMRWSDFDVEGSISGVCVETSEPDAGPVDARLPDCEDLGCSPIGIFCTPSGCSCTPPNGTETACTHGPRTDAGVDASPGDASGDGPLPTCSGLGCAPITIFCSPSGCVCTPPGGSETPCTN